MRSQCGITVRSAPSCQAVTRSLREIRLEIRNFDARVFCGEIGREAWGYIEYEQALFPGQAQSYELILAPGQEKR